MNSVTSSVKNCCNNQKYIIAENAFYIKQMLKKLELYSLDDNFSSQLIVQIY